MTTMDVMKNEFECVKRAEKGCDRQCDKCDLLMDTEVIKLAYMNVLTLLSVNNTMAEIWMCGQDLELKAKE